MSHKKAFAINSLLERAVNEAEAYFTGQIIENPDVVVTRNPGYLHSAVGQLGQGAKEAREALRHHVMILKPIVQNIA